MPTDFQDDDGQDNNDAVNYNRINSKFGSKNVYSHHRGLRNK